MSNPLVHAERSARRWGGNPEDYLEVHRWFDATKQCLFDVRHRMVLHNAFGILLCEQVFGAAITNSAGKRVFIRDIGLIYEVAVTDEGAAHVKMTLTSPGCPSGAEIMEDVRQTLADLEGITAVDVELVWEPYWTPERMDPRVRAFLGH